MIADQTLGTLVAESPSRSRVFEALGLDYCCGGRKSLRDACAQKALVLESVIAQLQQDEPETRLNPADLPSSELADYIEETHHAFLRQELPRLTRLLEKVAAAHGDAHPFLKELQTTFLPFRAELEEHLQKEEQVLFPWIRQGGSVALAQPIEVMESEHESAGEALAQFRTLTNNYTVPPDGCGTFRALMEALERLEQDLHQHVHLENNVLFARALEL